MDQVPCASLVAFHQRLLRLHPPGPEDRQYHRVWTQRVRMGSTGRLRWDVGRHPRYTPGNVHVSRRPLPSAYSRSRVIPLETIPSRSNTSQRSNASHRSNNSQRSNTNQPSSNTPRSQTAAASDGDHTDIGAHLEMAGTGPDTRPAHSAFGKYQKIFIVVMVTLASFFSPLSGQIYYPVMPTLVKNYHLTTALVNLTITTYMILQGLAPSFMGTFADNGGRRPAYVVAFAIYTAANIGLALQNSFAALLVLRCIQSAGSSGTVAFGYGVIADIATPAERGKYIGPMSAGVMVAPALGPVIGGLLSKFLGWRSVFWFLVIVSGGYLVVYMIAMPETARAIVGDGSLPPKECWRMSLVQYLFSRRRGRMAAASETNQEGSENQQSSSKLKFPNPLASFAILLEKDAFIIISYVGLVMFGNIALLTSTPNLFPRLYGFNELQVGLCFL